MNRLIWAGIVSMGAASDYSLEIPPKGRVFSIIAENPRSPLHWLAMLKHEVGISTCIYTRLSPQRLSQHIDLNQTEFFWLSESMEDYALSPSLERLHHAISTRISTDSGIIWLDAIEYLISRQGFEAFLSFTRSLADEISRTNWTLILPFSPLSMEDTQLAHIRREASPIEVGKLPEMDHSAIIAEPEIEDTADVAEESSTITETEDTVVDSEFIPKVGSLTMLSTINESALTNAVLNRRIQQWENMGFDVSILQPQHWAHSNEKYQIYKETEDLIRRAIECERRIQMIEVRGHNVEAAKMRFRIMQLTGISEIEATLDEILRGD